MKLPNGDRALVDIAKLRDYCLSPTHVNGKHKARVFRSALGFDQSHAIELRTILLRVALERDARLGEKDSFGQRYLIDFPLSGRAGEVFVRSAWIILNGEDVPRLTSCYIQL
jgi:hypothetical protein